MLRLSPVTRGVDSPRLFLENRDFPGRPPARSWPRTWSLFGEKSDQQKVNLFPGFPETGLVRPCPGLAFSRKIEKTRAGASLVHFLPDLEPHDKKSISNEILRVRVQDPKKPEKTRKNRIPPTTFFWVTPKNRKKGSLKP